jgi:hypothetical protein
MSSDVVEEVDGLTNENITIKEQREISKASEIYLDVRFVYPDEGQVWDGSIPTNYRRTGVFEQTPEGMADVVSQGYDYMHPSKREGWEEEQEEFWADFGGAVTDEFFYVMMDAEWHCGHEFPDNDNPARRIQTIKEKGYTLSSKRMACDECGKTRMHRQIVRFPRGGPRGYETLSDDLRERIIKTLGKYDVFENTTRQSGLLPDHKFPEIRWDDDVKEDNPDDMPEEKIREKFQLLDNQRNQQKREVCRNCFQNGKRGKPFGIDFFYEGDEDWPDDVPEVGEEAEQGCVGCGWYDMQTWREELNEELAELD